MRLFRYFPGSATLTFNGGAWLNERQRDNLLQYLHTNELTWRKRGHLDLANFFRELVHQVELENHLGAQLIMQVFERAGSYAKILPRYATN